MAIQEIIDKMDYGVAPENEKEAHKWLESFDRKFKLYIDGKWIEPTDKQYFEVFTPRSGELLANVAQAGEDDVEKAVLAAEKGLKAWRKFSSHDRAKMLYAIARHIQKHSRLLAVLESLDNGKPIRETRDIDIPLVARHFYYHAGWAQLKDRRFNDYEEIGIIGQIIPWNFPTLMLSWKIAPALAMGNVVILKPAEFTPLTALFFAQICQEVGLPDGVVNILTGDGETGALLVNHPKIKKIAFTGSTEVGKIIRNVTAGTGKKLSLELGGKSPFVVFEDADLDSAVEGLIDGIWFNQGQVCCAGSRLLVQESVAEKFISKVKERIEKLRIGDPLDKSTDIGAIVDKIQLERIQEYIEIGKNEGKIFQPNIKLPKGGWYCPPTLFTEVGTSAVIAQEEIFGPVLVSMTFRTPKEAVLLANNTRYGLAATVWSENINLALDVASQILAGTVWINSTNLFDAASGFGGYRESGYGREGGIEGLKEYLTPKWKGKTKSRVYKEDNTLPPKPKKSKEILIDRTPKLYIGGKQVRPDGGYSVTINDIWGDYFGEVGKGNRKDIRNAVEAAEKGIKWKRFTAHARSQVLYFIAENLQQRKNQFLETLQRISGYSEEEAVKEFELSIERIFIYAGLADKFDGLVHTPPFRNVTLAMNEPLGVIGIVCPEKNPLLGFVSTVFPALAMGNRAVCIPSEQNPFVVTDFYQVLETSDLPEGSLNIVTGSKDELVDVLSKHAGVDGIWNLGNPQLNELVEKNSSTNMKRVFTDYIERDWFNMTEGESSEFLQEATQVKNIWVPYGE